jgi:DNA-binding transcriptional LysR family regulator
MLDVRKLRVLVAIAEHGGIAAAARALSFTPPAVSQQVAALERQLDVALIDRSQHSARLTSAGTRLASHARQVIASLEAAEADLASVTGRLHDSIRLSLIPTLGYGFVPRCLESLRRDEPELNLRIQLMEAESSLPALVRGELDVVLAGEYSLTPRRPDASFERIDLFSERMLVAVPVSDRPERSRIQLADLRDARWIAPEAGSSCALLLERSCALAGFEPHIVARSPDFAVAASLAGAGYGVALVPRLLSSGNDLAFDGGRGVKLLDVVDPAVSRTLYAAVRRGARHHPAVAALLDAFVRTVEDGPWSDLADDAVSA